MTRNTCRLAPSVPLAWITFAIASNCAAKFPVSAPKRAVSVALVLFRIGFNTALLASASDITVCAACTRLSL